jgi:Rab GDP dissociation inhibitor
MGATHGVCKKGYYIVIISTTKEKESVEEDMKVAFELVGKILHRFDIEEVMYEAKDYSDNIFITSSLDATSHFESSAEDVCKVYEAMTGKQLDLTLPEKMD